MGILGKLLLVVNLLLGGGFIYLAVQDWKARQGITAGGLRHLILLQGVPLGRPEDPTAMPTDPEAEIPFPMDGPGGIPTTTVGPDLLKAYFQAAGGGTPVEGAVALASTDPVPNQLAEVKRVQDKVRAHVEGAGDAAGKARAAAPLLLLQAESFEERVEYQKLIAAGSGDELARRLYGKFDQVVNPPKNPDTAGLDPAAEPDAVLAKASELRAGGVKDDAERRAKIAHLLVHLSTDPAWQKRVMMVVGVRRYARAVGEQAVRFADMADRVRRGMDEDQEEFIVKYAQLREQAIERTRLVNDRAEIKKQLDEEIVRDQGVIAQRTTQLKEMRDQLAKVKAEVDDLLAKQTAVEQQLFAVQREVGLTLEEIYKLEADLARAERERYKATRPAAATPRDN